MSATDVMEGWAKVRNCFSDLSKTSAEHFIKGVVIGSIDSMPEVGLLHIARLELLVRAFPNDKYLMEIYQYMLHRTNNYIWGMKDYDVKEHKDFLFKCQPEFHKKSYSFDYKDNWYIKRVVRDNPKFNAYIYDMFI